jgi:hypothetical protein
MITRALSHQVKPELAEDVALALSRTEWIRAKKPTTSVKAIARRTLRSYIESKRMETSLDEGGAQWRHQPPEMTGGAGRMLRLRVEIEGRRATLEGMSMADQYSSNNPQGREDHNGTV